MHLEWIHLGILKKMVHGYNVKIPVLLEPMSDDVQLGFVQHFLKFQSASLFVKGRIWILWELALNISFNTLANQLIYVKIRVSSGLQFSFSAIYGRCTRIARRPLWNALESLAGLRQGPWMIAEDFNVISKASEILGVSSLNV